MKDLAAGDVSAFAAIYDRHAPRVYGLLARLLRYHGGADDVLQETFWHAWNTAGRYDPRRSTPAVWLFLIARSKAIDALRRGRRDPAAGSYFEPALESDASAQVESEELSASVRGGLSRLPEEQRTALVLAFYDGLTHEEIARRQDIPLGTAKTRIRLGMKRLREYLANYQEDAA